ncbi:MAG: STAS domain-containing protein [Vicinamibacterales bacterium]
MTATTMETQTPTFTTACVKTSDQVVVRVTGRLMAADRPRTWAPCLERTPGSEVQIDLSSVTEMDASGLGLLADFAREARANGRRVAVVSASRRVQRLLKLTHLDALLHDNVQGPRVAA